jgi:hypothetical protein
MARWRARPSRLTRPPPAPASRGFTRGAGPRPRAPGRRMSLDQRTRLRRGRAGGRERRGADRRPGGL